MDVSRQYGPEISAGLRRPYGKLHSGALENRPYSAAPPPSPQVPVPALSHLSFKILLI